MWQNLSRDEKIIIQLSIIKEYLFPMSMSIIQNCIEALNLSGYAEISTIPALKLSDKLN